MASKLTSAIDFEKTMHKSLGEISAAEFLELLQHPKLRVSQKVLLPDKKKYELWVEEGVISRIPIGVILEKLKGEKKKVELEPGPFLGERVFPASLRDAQYGQLVEDIAVRLESRLGSSFIDQLKRGVTTEG